MELQIGTLVLRLDDAAETWMQKRMRPGTGAMMCDVGGTQKHPVKDTILNTTLKSVGLVAEVSQEASVNPLKIQTSSCKVSTFSGVFLAKFAVPDSILAGRSSWRAECRLED